MKPLYSKIKPYFRQPSMMRKVNMLLEEKDEVETREPIIEYFSFPELTLDED